ncbi:MAG: transcriptional regulator [Candidatus Falkowbacteria bacterium GW2011_GWC2_38_22]|uniref:Probable transcriptional regulatory protein US91_C0001G0112 n=1 Tax=Candidatus Falkowbacteria bacterium GW2011_GWE1_38_31 TaxID=1618638 RepID=A0A0G0K6W7_9BACT|nr:MAG: transcriptional regulator [Candidatus Falkowbacteria bacterium GW2011_GWF2_38_1205]KKQ61771.1 MAG: transcriptional regulator [Candidatus Falkowbacteria bacterium GW2011_GWC2_38_22]KKQ64079.1 MAG: transcriptional regulator [Candidatus Falkowbacteria bacterium GW2011_GWF1_38_22]KKQ66572.1 MAG: transcriptional regulator [Candidatus Falkowbacteria bacterium GW2011_GWE2_38_254]KKQ71185.1 MAG: transcriptional regulator [Candidatus Falkowbacteria bacterium GW2011_GWE1_38_31]KKQ73313.1 MAG: tr
MSGHSKWATIKRKKEVTDSKRGAVFTKLGNIISIAAREKGGDIETNFSLRMAVEKAKAANMPKENIERAIKRGTGEGGGEQIVELIYEGIGPANSQFIVKVLTDNKNRSAASVRHAFTKYGGSLGTVMWNFEQKGVIRVSSVEFRISNDEDELELIEAGADDILKEEEGVTIYTKPENLQKVKKFLDEKKINTESAEIEYIAKDEVEISGEDKEKIEKFIDELDGIEDVSDYYNNVL